MPILQSHLNPKRTHGLGVLQPGGRRNPRNLIFQESHFKGVGTCNGDVVSLIGVRWILASTFLFLTACGPGLQFNIPQQMSQDQMLERATHAFVGVIEKQAFENWPFFSVPGFPGFDPKYRRYWRVLRREVRVEIVVKGVEARKRINIYEITWTGGTTGDWNSTQDNERDLFLVRVESGRYHVVRDWWRSIFPVYSGRHDRLPLDESRPFWERMGLLTWWVQPDHGIDVRWFDRNDPGSALGSWRRTKLLRGLLRHPDPGLRLRACKELLFMGLGQDECWDNLSLEDRTQLIEGAPGWLTPDSISKNHLGFVQHAKELWDTLSNDQDQLRLFTTANDQRIRREFCRLYQLRFPGDMDTGCPADRPIPATVVTEGGDIPLLGNWPHQ